MDVPPQTASVNADAFLDQLVDAVAERVASRLASQFTPQQAVDDGALTVAQAAQFCRCSEAHLNAGRVYGNGPKFVKLGGGRHVRYLKADLLDWLRTNVRTNTARGKR